MQRKGRPVKQGNPSKSMFVYPMWSQFNKTGNPIISSRDSVPILTVLDIYFVIQQSTEVLTRCLRHDTTRYMEDTYYRRTRKGYSMAMLVTAAVAVAAFVYFLS